MNASSRTSRRYRWSELAGRPWRLHGYDVRAYADEGTLEVRIYSGYDADSIYYDYYPDGFAVQPDFSGSLAVIHVTQFEPDWKEETVQETG